MVHEPHEPHERLLFGEEVFRIQGAIYEVNRVKGAGFPDAVYQECLALEFGARGISFAAQPVLPLDYKGVPLRATYIPDFICFGSVLVELKALTAIASEHRAQVLNYLAGSGHQTALLLNFGAERLEYKRFILTKPRWIPPSV